MDVTCSAKLCMRSGIVEMFGERPRLMLLIKAHKPISGQMGLFAAPERPPAGASKPKPASGSKPPGAGWQAIPGGGHGGFRKKKGKGWEYWYPKGAKPAEPRETVNESEPENMPRHLAGKIGDNITEGSEKQIAWAKKIAGGFKIPNQTMMASMMDDMKGRGYDTDKAHALAEEFLASQTSAKWWIDNKSKWMSENQIVPLVAYMISDKRKESQAKRDQANAPSGLANFLAEKLKGKVRTSMVKSIFGPSPRLTLRTP